MIRLANKEDLPKVCELVKLGIGQLVFTYKVNDATLADSIYRSFMVAPCFLVEEDGEIVGCASMGLSTFPWSQKPFLNSNMVYVLPEHRKPVIIKELYNAIKKYAELHGILYCDTFVGMDKIDGRLRLAKSQGLTQTGISIMYDGAKK